MPLGKSAQQLTDPRRVLLTANGISELAHIHRDAVLRELARGSIQADWEQVVVYLAEQAEGPPVPAWVVFSAHDEVGDDLRRR